MMILGWPLNRLLGAGLAVLIQQYQRFSLATFKARQTTTEANYSFLTSSSSIYINNEGLLPQLIPELPFA
jgi:hypothetical protein